MAIVDENKSVRWPQCLAAFAGKNLRLNNFLEVLIANEIPHIQTNIGTFATDSMTGWSRYFTEYCKKSIKYA
jgi:hypothetical protein